MAVLTQDQKDQFWRDGFVCVPNAVTSEQLKALRSQMDAWEEESRSENAPYGEIMDGRARFDLAPDHSADQPKLRRVSAPVDISKDYENVMRDSAMVDMVAELIGPSVKFHHSKINAKQPGALTEVKWHQDFPFTPHTNSDCITALLFVDEVTSENGPLEVAPGSHKGPLLSLWHDDVFTGAIDDASADEMKATAAYSSGQAGSVCLMHSKLAHGSTANNSDRPRTLFIINYTAGDAHPLTPNPVPSKFSGEFVRGEDPKSIRAEPYDVAVPQYPKGASFFVQQERPTA